MSESAVRTAFTLTGRTLRLSRRNTEALVISLVLPIMLMLVFVYLFGGALQTGTEYVTYVVPGVLLLCAAFGASLTAAAVTHDMTSGIIDRFRSMDVGGTWFLFSHVIASLARNAVSTTVVLGVAVAIGFRPETTPLRALAAAGVLLFFVLAVSWLAAVAADRPNPRGGRRFHLRPDVPALCQQRVRPDRHDARLAAHLRRTPAGDAGGGESARIPAQHPNGTGWVPGWLWPGALVCW